MLSNLDGPVSLLARLILPHQFLGVDARPRILFMFAVGWQLAVSACLGVEVRYEEFALYGYRFQKVVLWIGRNWGCPDVGRHGRGGGKGLDHISLPFCALSS